MTIISHLSRNPSLYFLSSIFLINNEAELQISEVIVDEPEGRINYSFKYRFPIISLRSESFHARIQLIPKWPPV